MRDYTAWAKGQNFHTKTIYEPEYIYRKDYRSWFTGLTRQQREDQAEFNRQRDTEMLRSQMKGVMAGASNGQEAWMTICTKAITRRAA